MQIHLQNFDSIFIKKSHFLENCSLEESRQLQSLEPEYQNIVILINLETKSYNVFCLESEVKARNFVQCLKCLNNFKKTKGKAEELDVYLPNAYLDYSKKIFEFLRKKNEVVNYGEFEFFGITSRLIRERGSYEVLNYFLRKIKYLELSGIGFESLDVEVFLEAVVQGDFWNLEKAVYLKMNKCDFFESRISQLVPRRGFVDLRVLEIMGCSVSSDVFFYEMSKILERSQNLELFSFKKNTLSSDYEDGFTHLCSSLSNLRRIRDINFSRNGLKGFVYDALIESILGKRDLLGIIQRIDVSFNNTEIEEQKIFTAVFERSIFFGKCEIVLDSQIVIFNRKIENLEIEEKKLESNSSGEMIAVNDFTRRAQAVLNFDKEIDQKKLNKSLDDLVEESMRMGYKGQLVDLLHYMKHLRDYKVNKLIYEKLPTTTEIQFLEERIGNTDPYYPLESNREHLRATKKEKYDDKTMNFIAAHPLVLDYKRIGLLDLCRIEDYVEISDQVNMKKMRNFTKEIYKKSAFLLSEFNSPEYIRCYHDSRLRLSRLCFWLFNHIPNEDNTVSFKQLEGSKYPKIQDTVVEIKDIVKSIAELSFEDEKNSKKITVIFCLIK